MKYSIPMHLYFICTGNTCRSPMAQKIMREKMPHEIIESRGLLQEVLPMSEGTAQVLREKYNCETFIQNHLSRQVDRIDVMLADLILTMQIRQRDILQNRYDIFAHKIHTIGDILGDPEYEIHDPLNKPYGEKCYRDLFWELDENLSKIVPLLNQYQPFPLK